MNSRTLTRTTGALLVVQALLLFVPVAILGSAINWPASLSEPPSVVLPLIQAQAGAVRIGYLVYLAFSILFFPVSLMVARVLAGSDTLPPLLRIAAIAAVRHACRDCSPSRSAAACACATAQGSPPI